MPWNHAAGRGSTDRSGLAVPATAVAPGGTLLVVGHAGFPPWASHADSDVHFPAPEEVLAALDLTPEQWDTTRLESAPREATGPDGQTATLTDSVLMLRRRSD